MPGLTSQVRPPADVGLLRRRSPRANARSRRRRSRRCRRARARSAGSGSRRSAARRASGRRRCRGRSAGRRTRRTACTARAGRRGCCRARHARQPQFEQRPQRVRADHVAAVDDGLAPAAFASATAAASIGARSWLSETMQIFTCTSRRGAVRTRSGGCPGAMPNTSSRRNSRISRSTAPWPCSRATSARISRAPWRL